MKIVGTVAALSLILSSIPLFTAVSAHAALAAPEKDSHFDSGSFAGNWVADQCESDGSGSGDSIGSAAAPLGASLTSHKLNIALSKGTLAVSDRSDSTGSPLNLSFGGINQGPEKGGAEAYTFIGGIFKTSGDASAMIKSLKDGAKLSLSTPGQSVKCHLTRSN